MVVKRSELCHLSRITCKFQYFLLPNGPSDLYAALGKNGQIIMLTSKGLVIVRMGEAASGTNSALQMT